MFEYRGVYRENDEKQRKQQESITLFLSWCLKHMQGRGRSGLGRDWPCCRVSRLCLGPSSLGATRKAFWMRLKEELGNRNETAVDLRRGRLFQGRQCLECPDSFWTSAYTFPSFQKPTSSICELWQLIHLVHRGCQKMRGMSPLVP